MKTIAQFWRMVGVMAFALVVGAGVWGVSVREARAATCYFSPDRIAANSSNRETEFYWSSAAGGVGDMTLSCSGVGAIYSDRVSGESGRRLIPSFGDDLEGVYLCRLIKIGTESLECERSLIVDKKALKTCQESCPVGNQCKCLNSEDSCRNIGGTKVGGTFSDASCNVCCAYSGSTSKTCTYNGKSGTCIASAQTCSGESGPASDNKCETAVEKCCVSSSSSTCNASYCKESCSSADDTSQGAACDGFCKSAYPGGKEKYCPPKNSGGGGSGTSSPVNITLVNPLKYNTVQQVLMALLYALQGVIVVLSLVFIVVGAVLYITSAGNQARVTSAKTAITAALIGLAIGILAPTFLKEIATVLGWNATAPLPTEVSGARSAADILLSVLNFLLGIVGVLAIIFLVVGAIMFLGATGDMNRIGVAKKIIQYALLGIVVALASLVIVRQLAEFFAPVP